MFSDPQFWVAVSFFLFIAAIFNPVKKILTSSLDSQIVDIKNDAPTPLAHVKPQNFGDLIKLAREYPKRKLIWCEDGYFAPYVD